MDPRKTRLLFMDERSANMYNYHFNDDILLHDIAWRHWRNKLQKLLNEDQLAGKRCAICNIPVVKEAEFSTESLGGYTLYTCTQPCEFSAITDAKARRHIKIQKASPKRRYV